MRQIMSPAIVAITLLIGLPCLGDDMAPRAILEQAAAAYREMETYKAEGTAVSNLDMGAMKGTVETSFTIRLKKPNLYLITWSQKNSGTPETQSGAVWNAGTQPYLYMSSLNAYSPMTNDMIALGAATGISGGAAATIPYLFLALPQEAQWAFSRLTNPMLKGSEQIGDEDCYVIGGPSSISKEETFWISKTSHLVRTYSRSLEAPAAGRKMPELTDEQLEESIKGMGLEVTEQRKKETREMMEGMAKMPSMKGAITEVHARVSSPESGQEDFTFALPEGAALKESFGDMVSSCGKTSALACPMESAPGKQQAKSGTPASKDTRDSASASLLATEAAKANQPQAQLADGNPLAEDGDKDDASQAPKRGQVSGIVTSATTGQPIVGAYVGAGGFGDAGGSNHERHRQEGLYAQGKTDEQGQFTLDGLAVGVLHPLFVTHPECVRHDEIVPLSESQPSVSVAVQLKPAARINVTVTDATGVPLPGQYLFRLRDSQGNRRIPPGTDPHLSSFASTAWTEGPRDGTFSFTELDEGAYAIDVIRVALASEQASAGRGRVLDDKATIYYGGIAESTVKPGQTWNLDVAAEEHATRLVSTMPSSDAFPKDFPRIFVIGRSSELPFEPKVKIRSLEDPKLARITEEALFYTFTTSDSFTVANLPPGEYSIFAGPILELEGAQVQLAPGQDTVVELPAKVD